LFIAEKFADYCENVKFDDFPEEVVDKTKKCLIDSLGCAIGGLATEAGSIITKISKEIGGSPESTVMGLWERVSAVNASFTNSILANALDFDDDHPVGHPGATIIPPSIAVGEKLHSNGKDLLTAIILGYEISLRIGLAIQPSMERLDKVWGLGTWQTFGSAVASAKLMKLSKDRYVNALGIAGANAPVPSVMKTVLGMSGVTMVKNNFGCASAVGVLSAMLAKEGFTGPRDVFDGETGFWRMYGSDRCDFEKMTERLGERYEILNVSFKPYPVCRWMHSAIDAALNIKKRYEIRPDDIKQVTIHSLSLIAKPPYTNDSPKNALEAQYSLPYSIAVAFYKKPGPSWFNKNTIENPKIRMLTQKVKIVASKEADSKYPEVLAVVEINSKKGNYTEKVNIPKGDPRNPMTDEELEDKFKRVASNCMRIENIKETLNLIKSIEEVNNNINQLIKVMTKNI